MVVLITQIMITKIDHLGIAVQSLDQAVPYYEKALGLKCERREEVASQKVRTAFFAVGEVHLELLEPTSPESPIAKFLEKNPAGGIHHIAFGSTDVAGQLRQASGAGVKLVHEIPFDGAGGKLVAFLHPKSTCGVLTELCMPKPA
jgi:methylmalonyl-CoA/ethylmalonyl-CoA epimerase